MQREYRIKTLSLKGGEGQFKNLIFLVKNKDIFILVGKDGVKAKMS